MTHFRLEGEFIVSSKASVKGSDWGGGDNATGSNVEPDSHESPVNADVYDREHHLKNIYNTAGTAQNTSSSDDSITDIDDLL